MPSLVAFGRKWAISSDDFVFPGITEACIRFFWILFAVFVYYIHYPLDCEAWNARLYLAILIILNAATIFICSTMAWISARGTIMNAQNRRHVSTCLYFRVPFFLIEVVWTMISTVLFFEGFSVCHSKVLLRTTIALEWILIGCVLLGVLIVFNPSSHDDTQDAMLITRRVWSRRLFIFKIRRDEIMRTAIDDIANMIASFFAEGDYVLSDIAAGLLLVVHSPVNKYPPLVAMDNAVPEWMNVKSAEHFAHFATCVYGWPSYLIQHAGCRPYCRLLRKMRCCGRLRCDQVLVVEDNCFLCNTAAFVLSTEAHNIDLFFVSFRNRLYETPFVVLADHDTRNVVITIRGSCSLTDLVTDLCLDDELLSVDVDADPVLRQDSDLDGHGQVRVHRGMLRSARYVFDQLRKHEILEDLKVLHPLYGLVICGHSLGAGVASLLTLLLKQTYPNIRCFSFAPPGCVISEEGQEEMRQHVMSVVTRDDLVPRISYHSLHRLRAAIVRELDASTKAKYEILIKGVFRILFKAPFEISDVHPQETDTQQLVGHNNTLPTYGSGETQVILPPQTPILVDESRIQLYAPGNILYVADEDTDSVVTKQWVDPKCLSDIKLSASAITDHLPKYVNYILNKAVAQDGLDDV